MSLKFRLANAAESDEIRDLVRGAYALYVPRMGREPAPMVADYEMLIAGKHLEVTETDGNIAGILVSFARGDHLHVENVAVSGAAQGRGVGRALMDRAEEQARNLGLNAVELYTNEVMEENFPFYAALGYVITGRAVEDGYKRVYFRKELGD
ncbi:MAG: GNAT family N-acetyltransferase [Hyphomicrobiales bacterium]|nr:GNAT family N-acetyltransferase [Hyphomicrobiales bacterium]